MFIILGLFAIVILMLLVGYIGELIFSSDVEEDQELKEGSEEYEEASTQNILDQLK